MRPLFKTPCKIWKKQNNSLPRSAKINGHQMVNWIDFNLCCCFIIRGKHFDNLCQLNLRHIYTYSKKGCFSDARFKDGGSSCSLNLFSLKTRANVYFFMIWFSPGVPSATKLINTFNYSEHDALRSMKQGSRIMHHWSNLIWNRCIFNLTFCSILFSTLSRIGMVSVAERMLTLRKGVVGATIR